MCVLFILLFFSSIQGLERKISYSKNPGCKSDDISLYYLRAEGPNDTLHYLWDFTNTPTVFLALTEVGDRLDVNCTGFINGNENSISFTKSPKYEFFLIITKLIEFNDINDTGILTPQTPSVSYDTKDFTWTEIQKLTGDDRFVTLTMLGKNFIQPQGSLLGNFSIQLTAFGFENHDSELPRLMHSPNSTQCKISLENLTSYSNFNESRYAFELVMVSNDKRTSSSKIATRKNLDDEHSPGIFSMVDVMTPKAQNQLFQGAFLQWRPIIYTAKVPSIGYSTEIVTYNLTSVPDPVKSLVNSLPFKYYGYNLESMLTEQIVVSLGITEDGFYKKTNFSSWTFLVNYGSPDEEKFSLLVILVMCIGFGLPALLIITGGTYMCARRIQRNKDELSLER